LLLEPTATALNNFSEQLDNAYWTGSAVVTANTTISPDGYQNADTLNDNTTAFLDKRRAITVTPNVAHTFTFFVKKTSGALTHYAGMAALLTGVATRVDYGIINTTTGAIVRDASSNINSVSYSSVSYGDYWRVVMTFTDNQSNTNCTIIIYPAISSNGTSISSNAQGSNVFWGVNLTQSAYATSYIPTLSTSVTRVADAASKSGISSLIGQTEGTLFAEFEINANNTDGLNRIFSVTDGTLTSRVLMIANTDETFRFVVSIGGSSLVNITTSTNVLGGRHKVAFAYKASDYVAYVDGVQVGSNTAVASVPASLTAAYVGTIEGGAAASGLEGTISQALLFKTRLSNSELASLTTL
jgi:hypothetical protein